MKKIIKNGQGEYIEKKSKFIAHIFNVESEQQAAAIIAEVKKKYWDARHNCYAYILGNKGEIQRFSDDGEPSGTAGKPILEVLSGNECSNCLCIVTRYFGGILLGTGGLVRAYSDVTLQAIDSIEKVEKTIGIEAEAEVEYNNLETFKYYCKKNNIYIKDYEYSEKIICKIQLEECSKERLIADFNTKKVNLIKLKFLSKKLIEKSIIKTIQRKLVFIISLLLLVATFIFLTYIDSWDLQAVETNTLFITDNVVCLLFLNCVFCIGTLFALTFLFSVVLHPITFLRYHYQSPFN